MLRAALVLLLCVRADGLMDLNIESQLNVFSICVRVCVCVCYACTCAREAKGQTLRLLYTCGYHNIL